MLHECTKCKKYFGDEHFIITTTKTGKIWKKCLYSKRGLKKSKFDVGSYNWIKESWLKHKYNLSFDNYEMLIKSQNNMCLICKDIFNSSIKPCVDHCHKTDKIRGILCSKCNAGIGLLNEDIMLMRNAIKYLKNEY